MQMRLALFSVVSMALLGCNSPNTPEPPPATPPVAPVSQTTVPPPIEPAVTKPPAVVTVEKPDKPQPAPVDPSPSQPVNVSEQIEKLTKNEDRQAAAEALASVGKSAVPALLKSLDHADWQVRAAAVFALGQIGSEAGEAKARLQTIAEKDENSSVRDAAAFALDAMEGK
jgi:outer membrane biosynthesis protein TonB